jgi:hypothetical protein
MIIPSHDMVVVRLGHFKGDEAGTSRPLLPAERPPDENLHPAPPWGCPCWWGWDWASCACEPNSADSDDSYV